MDEIDKETPDEHGERPVIDNIVAPVDGWPSPPMKPRPVADPAHGARAPKLVASRASGLPVVSFDRHELSQILRVYGRMVAAGEWRDYAVDHLKDRAVFSIFRRASEVPLYRVEKEPALARRQGTYSVVSQNGMILKRGQELARVLRVIDKSLKLVD